MPQFLEDLFTSLKSLVNARPDAMTRITRTPVYKTTMRTGYKGEYLPSLLGLLGNISVPRGAEMDDPTLRHESAHAIYDQADLSRFKEQLAPVVPGRIKALLSEYPIYTRKGLNSNLYADEALGFSVEDPKYQAYTEVVTKLIKDPVLKQRLLRIQKK